ncbi:MAG: cysteine desulfurase family protein [bacterium]|nr:cysteine desulfurase family protein [bacterium]
MIYLDHAATTACAPEAVQAMLPYFTELYGNPSNIYGLSLQSRKAVNKARADVAKAINATQGAEITFTASGTEADNLAIMGIARARAEVGRHLITTRIEHHAVLNCFQELEREGFKVTYLPVNKEGIVSVETIAQAITKETTLVSVMLANNEIGTIQPLAAISDLTRPRGIYLHTDAVQAASAMQLDVQALGVDALSISAHKFYGPKGVGALYLRQGCHPSPVIFGGGQEKGLRSGTENVPGIVGLAMALTLVNENGEEKRRHLTALREQLIEGVLAKISGVIVTGSRTERLPGTASFVIKDIEGESLVIQLDRRGICASAGAACTSSQSGGSHVLKALGLPSPLTRGNLRISIGYENTPDEITQTINALAESIELLRSIAPRRHSKRRN